MSRPIIFKALILNLLIILVGCNAFNGADPESQSIDAPAETPEVAVTQEVVDTLNPLPGNNGAYYVAPSYATIEENHNVTEAPGGFYWVVATVSLGNSAGETVTVNPDDITMVGDNGRRYPTYEMIPEVSPQLVNTELAEGESIYGFALFALPPDVEPSLFEWCPNGTCDAPLQAEISLQRN